jgi:hypothetical protein
MSTAYESATLIIRLYELRREPTMRDARAWFARDFHPTSADDIFQILGSPHSGHFRMVTSYWDMASSFVLNGAIDEKMFNDANGEHIFIFAKIEQLVAEYRVKSGNPNYLKSLETVVLQKPGAREQMASIRERFGPRK